LIDRETAERARDEILQGMYHLNRSLVLADGHFPDETYQLMRRGVGVAIGRLEVDYLHHIFALYPDLDDVANPDSVKRDVDGSVCRPEAQVKRYDDERE
jgi:hypothetical protein